MLRLQKHNYLKIKELHLLRQRDSMRSLILKEAFLSPPPYAENPKVLRPLNRGHSNFSPTNIKNMGMTNLSFKAMNYKVK